MRKYWEIRGDVPVGLKDRSANYSQVAQSDYRYFVEKVLFGVQECMRKEEFQDWIRINIPYDYLTPPSEGISTFTNIRDLDNHRYPSGSERYSLLADYHFRDGGVIPGPTNMFSFPRPEIVSYSPGDYESTGSIREIRVDIMSSIVGLDPVLLENDPGLYIDLIVQHFLDGIRKILQNRLIHLFLARGGERVHSILGIDLDGWLDHKTPDYGSSSNSGGLMKIYTKLKYTEV